MKIIFYVLLIGLLPTLLVAQKWGISYSVKAGDVRTYRATIDGGSNNVKMIFPATAVITNMGVTPFVLSLRAEFPTHFFQFSFTDFEESFSARITSSRGIGFTEPFRMSGLEYAFGAGKSFYTSTRKINISAYLLFRQTLVSPHTISLIPICNLALPPSRCKFIYDQVEDINSFRPFWAISLESDAFNGIFPTLKVGKSIEKIGNNYAGSYFASLLFTAKTWRFSPKKGKKYF